MILNLNIFNNRTKDLHLTRQRNKLIELSVFKTNYVKFYRINYKKKAIQKFIKTIQYKLSMYCKINFKK